MDKETLLQCRIKIQEQDFSVTNEYQFLRSLTPESTGAICSFVGLVREFGDAKGVTGMFLEHYPGMTEKSLQTIIDQAYDRWKFHAVTVIHRVGALKLTDQIVFVAVCSAHRRDAFAACEFIMDFLKTSAPFWKKEMSQDKSQWVEAKQSDQESTQKWLK